MMSMGVSVRGMMLVGMQIVVVVIACEKMRIFGYRGGFVEMCVVRRFISMQVIHIMVMVVMSEDYVKVAGTDAGFQDIFYFNGISGQQKTVKCLPEFFLISSQIEKCCDCHVTADSGSTFYI